MNKTVGVYNLRRAAIGFVLTVALSLSPVAAGQYTATAADPEPALTVSADTGGTVTGTLSGSYAEGTQITATATPETGYAFGGWDITTTAKIDYVQTSGSAVIAFAMPAQDVTLKASFTPTDAAVVPPAAEPGDTNLPALSKLKISKVKAGKKKLTVTWSAAPAAQKVAGYQISYRTAKAGKKKAGKWVTKSAVASKKSYVIKKLKKGNSYQVRLRSWRSESGKKVYSKWSAVKKSGKVK